MDNGLDTFDHLVAYGMFTGRGQHILIEMLDLLMQSNGSLAVLKVTHTPRTTAILANHFGMLVQIQYARFVVHNTFPARWIVVAIGSLVQRHLRRGIGYKVIGAGVAVRAGGDSGAGAGATGAAAVAAAAVAGGASSIANGCR